ncbi:mCG148034 [Mus musculus]|nr:mCG148034 [Mus musculus]
MFVREKPGNTWVDCLHGAGDRVACSRAQHFGEPAYI